MQYPKSWPADKVGSLFDVRIGGTPSRKEPSYWDSSKTSDNVWLSIRDVSNLRSIEASESSEYISDLGIKNSNVKLIPKNTAIMTFKLTLGKTAVTTRDLYTNEAIAAFVPKPSVTADPYYLATILPLLDYDIDQAVKGSTLNKVKIQDALIPLPDIKVQKRIAAILGSIDAATTSTQKVIDQTERLKKSLTHQLLFNSARNHKLGDILSFEYGASLPEESRVEGEVRVFGSNGPVGYHSESLINGPGIIVGRKGSIGKVAWSNNDFWPIDTTYYVKTKLDLRFIYYLLIALDLSKYNRASGVPGLNRDDAYSIGVSIPERAEQQKIVDILFSVDQKIAINTALKAAQEQLKKSLMRDLLTGKVQV